MTDLFSQAIAGRFDIISNISGHDDARQLTVRRILKCLASGQLFVDEALVIVFLGPGEGGHFIIIGLQDNGTGALSAPGSARDLGEQLKAALNRAIIWQVEGSISSQHSY